MNLSEIMEIRKTFAYKPQDTAVSYYCGCFINTDREIKGEFTEKLYSEESVLIHKFLEIYKKALANNNADISFDVKDRQDGGIQFLLEKLRASELNNKDINRIFFEKIRDCLPENNFVVTLVHNTYDVPVKTSDRQKIDDASAEIFRFILCAVCPVKTTKGTLGYLADKEKIDENPQQLVVDKPVFGFMYPSFNDRSSDTGKILCYRTEKLDISRALLEHQAPEIIKPEKKALVKRSLNENSENGSIPETGTENSRITIGEPAVQGISQYGLQNSSIPSLDTGTLSNSASYIKERTIDDEASDTSASAGPSERELISSSGTTMKISSSQPTKKRRPIRITGDMSLVEKKIIDGRTYYVISATDAEISET